MADSMDLVQQRVEEDRLRHINNARAKTPGASRVLCIDCDAPIPPARRRAAPYRACSAASPARKFQSLKGSITTEVLYEQRA